MSFGSIIFTDRGRLLQAKAQTGKQLNFTKIQLGDGALGGQAIQPLSALISPKKNVAITTIKIGEGTATVGGVLNNSDITTGFYWREVGLFARDPDTNAEVLYCYGNAGALAEYIPAGGGSEILEKRLDIIAIIGNAANVSATIDSSLVFLTPSELDGHNTSPQAHEDIRLLINNLSNPATKEALGLVKIGDNLTVDAEGRVSGPAAYTHPAAKQCNYVAPVSSVAGRTGAVTLAKGDVGLGLVENYGIATTAEAQEGEVNNKYMTPALVKEAIGKLGGGDYMGKKIRIETIAITSGIVSSPGILIKSYSNPNGGIVRINVEHIYRVGLRIIVDGSLISSSTQVYRSMVGNNTTSGGGSVYYSGNTIIIPFNSSFELRAVSIGSIPENATFTAHLMYYLNE